MEIIEKIYKTRECKRKAIYIYIYISFTAFFPSFLCLRFRSNQSIGEATFDIYDWLMLVYHRKEQPVYPFKERKDVSALNMFHNISLLCNIKLITLYNMLYYIISYFVIIILFHIIL